MQVDHYVTLHLTATQAEVIPAMQGDGARCLLASLMANGEPWAVPEGTSVGIAYTLPDKTADYYDRLTDGSPAATVAGNLVTVTLAPVLTKQAGTAKLSLVLRQGEKQIATFPLQLKVQAAVGKVLGEDVPVQADGFEGKLYYGGPGGTIIPLALGPGLAVRDGTVVVEGAERPGADSGQNVELDTTLTQSGKAADAKAVGDALDKLEEKIPSIEGLAKEGDIPMKTSELTNDSGYQTAAQVTAIVQRQLGVIENGTY